MITTDWLRSFRRLVATTVAICLLASMLGGCGLARTGLGLGASAVRTTAAAGTMALGTAIALAPIKIMFACLPEGTFIDTPAGPQPVETLRAGDTVIGYDGEEVVIQQVHGYLEDPEETFYEIGFSNGGKVDLCGMHRIGGIRAQDLTPGDTLEVQGEVFTVSSLRTYTEVQRSYDLLTTDAGYQIGGIPVNSMIVEMYEAGQTGVTREGDAISAD
ncbi:MAG: Hint domain-containing protein [Verrucomicrobiota bacterium]